MGNKITTIRLPEKYIEYLEKIRNDIYIKNNIYKYTPDKTTTTELILFAIAYTAKTIKNKDPE